MLLKRISPRMRATILASIVGGLAEIAIVLLFRLANSDLEIPPGLPELISIVVFQILLLLNIFALLAYAIEDSVVPAVFTGIVFLSNALGYGALTWLLWPTMKRLNRIQIRLPRPRAKPPTASSPTE